MLSQTRKIRVIKTIAQLHREMKVQSLAAVSVKGIQTRRWTSGSDDMRADHTDRYINMLTRILSSFQWIRSVAREEHRSSVWLNVSY